MSENAINSLADATTAIKQLRAHILFYSDLDDAIHEDVSHLYLEALAHMEIAGFRMQEAMIQNARLGGKR